MVQADRIKPQIIVICGPTASGKTALAVSLAKALQTEIISADSMNIYRGLDIGTAKPTERERQGVPHHMIDILPPDATFSVGDYREKAQPIVNKLIEKGKIPIICGGTGFYINSLLFDLSYGNAPGNIAVREKYQKMAEEEGNEAVFSVLKKADPFSAEKLHPNDLKRVIRALEIYEQTGTPKSALCDSQVPRYRYRSFCVDYLRGELYRRINERVDKMLDCGLIEEVDALRRQGISADMQSMQGIGYKEVYDYLQSGGSVGALSDRIKQNTRRYAKRQITFFKRDRMLAAIEPDTPEAMAQTIKEFL